MWLSQSDNPNRKLKYSWEVIEADGALVGINTAHPNGLVEDALKAGMVPELNGFAGLRREVKYGKNSRIDILLEGGDGGLTYVEVKNVPPDAGAGPCGIPRFGDGPRRQASGRNV